MAVKQPTLLYFIPGPVPNADNIAEANSFRGKGAVVNFRNSLLVGDNDASPEEAQGALGDVPEIYKKLPSADDAIDAYNKSLEDEQAKYKAASSATGATGNSGTATTASLGRTPVAAAVRPADIPQNKTPVEAPKAEPTNMTTVGVENLGANANQAGQPTPAVDQTAGQQQPAGQQQTGNLTPNPFAPKQ